MVKSLPRYFLMVLALAGDSTMTRYLLIELSCTSFFQCNPTGIRRACRTSRIVRLPPRGNMPVASQCIAVDDVALMQPAGIDLEQQIFHPGEGGYLAGLIEEYQQDIPFQVGEIGFVGVERHDAVDHHFAAGEVQYAELFEQ